MPLHVQSPPLCFGCTAIQQHLVSLLAPCRRCHVSTPDMEQGMHSCGVMLWRLCTCRGTEWQDPDPPCRPQKGHSSMYQPQPSQASASPCTPARPGEFAICSFGSSQAPFDCMVSKAGKYPFQPLILISGLLSSRIAKERPNSLVSRNKTPKWMKPRTVARCMHASVLIHHAE